MNPYDFLRTGWGGGPPHWKILVEFRRKELAILPHSDPAHYTVLDHLVIIPDDQMGPPLVALKSSCNRLAGRSTTGILFKVQKSFNMTYV